MIQRLRTAPLVLALLAAASADAQVGSYLRVMSWNLRHEGWQGETDFRADAQQIWNVFGSTSTSPNGCDVVFLQEVMNKDVPINLVNDLAQVSGYTWSYVVTAPIGRTTYKEHYAMVYRTDRVKVVSSYLYNDVGDKFEREPLVVKLVDKATGADYTFIDWHAVFGTNAQRAAELAEIATVFRSVQDSDATDQDVILLGDHNADATSTWWNTFKTTVAPPPACTLNIATSRRTPPARSRLRLRLLLDAAEVRHRVLDVGPRLRGRHGELLQPPLDHAPVWLKLYSTSDTD
ncbi:MAG: endonuclease/exonuclease/phosphatase family protein [Acidobacteriota bacterium]